MWKFFPCQIHKHLSLISNYISSDINIPHAQSKMNISKSATQINAFLQFSATTKEASWLNSDRIIALHMPSLFYFRNLEYLKAFNQLLYKSLSRESIETKRHWKTSVSRNEMFFISMTTSSILCCGTNWIASL